MALGPCETDLLLLSMRDTLGDSAMGEGGAGERGVNLLAFKLASRVGTRPLSLCVPPPMSDNLDCFFLAVDACLAAQSMARGVRPEGGRFAIGFARVWKNKMIEMKRPTYENHK